MYEIISTNMVEPGRSLRVACWASKATRAQAHASTCATTHTHTQTPKCVIIISFPREQWFHLSCYIYFNLNTFIVQDTHEQDCQVVMCMLHISRGLRLARIVSQLPNAGFMWRALRRSQGLKQCGILASLRH